MSGRGRNHRYRKDNRQQSHSLASSAREQALSLPGDSPVLALFRSAAMKLNDRHDRHERLVKLSRDITIESKRIIFLLHSPITKEDTEKAILEADDRLKKLISGPIKYISKELENSPNYLHHRAITPGLQEFIEAKTLWHLLKEKKLPLHADVQKEFVYVVMEKIVQAKEDSAEGETEEIEVEKQLTTVLPQVDFMLGLADLSGELMRRVINCLSSGDSEECFNSCQIVRDLYTGFQGIFGGGKEIARKLGTTRLNVSKVEAAVYALHVRGGEAPPSLLLPAAQPPIPADIENRDSDDEGYF